MQHIGFFKKAMYTVMTAGTLIFATSCDKNDDNNDTTMYAISGSATGAQETPAVSTTATGSLSGTYNKSTNSLNYTITWTGLSSTVVAAHFHGPAAMGVSADPLVTITVSNTGVTATATGTVAVDDATEQALLDGKVYYNIHTVNNPNGEIRGQVSLTASN